jgi:hypothetical protein
MLFFFKVWHVVLDIITNCRSLGLYVRSALVSSVVRRSLQVRVALHHGRFSILMYVYMTFVIFDVLTVLTVEYNAM